MKNCIFYSWQSDLPNRTNRGFIESCIESAIKKLDRADDFYLELNLDRDTKNEPGTPDIANTIFSKIERAKIFIADISIINSNSDGRKTPNPNILLELGYAAKVLGWEKIICIFNTDYGNFDDLPFDLRFRRPLIYSLKNKSKPEVRKYLSKAIFRTITELNSKGMISDELNNYIKVQADTQILYIINHLYKILYGYNETDYSLEEVEVFMNLNFEEIKSILLERKFLGFQVFKKFEELEGKIRKILDKITASNHYKKELGVTLVNLIKWIGVFDKFNSSRQSPDLFIKANESAENFKTVYGPDINPSNKEGYLLLKKIDKEHGIVRDFGDFQEKHKIDSMLEYVYINNKYVDRYANLIVDLIEITNNWLERTNGEFLIDNINYFEFNHKRKLKQTLETDDEATDESVKLLKYIYRKDFDFNYDNISRINSLKYLVENLIKHGHEFKNHKQLLKKLNNEIVAAYDCEKNPVNLIVPWVEETKNQENDDSEFEGENNKVPHIYITNNYLELRTLLSKCLEVSSIPSEIKELTEKILAESKKNLTVIFKKILEHFIDNYCGEDKKNEIDPNEVSDKFNYNRFYHEKHFNELNSEIRKHLKKNNIF